VKNNLNNNLKEIDTIIKNIINKYVSKEKLDPKQSLSVNIFFEDENTEDVFEDVECLYEDDFKIILTLYFPHTINKLRFDLISDRKIIIKSSDYSFYKQFWFSIPIVKESLTPKYKNNVLEISFLKKNGPAQI
jgi:hypothetical protein